jgi:tetratricopeptide (TPR) repeat protein
MNKYRLIFLTLLLLFSNACKKDPSVEFFKQAFEEHRKGNLLESLELYIKGLELEPESHEMRLRYGNVLEDAGQVYSAISEYEMVLKAVPKHVNAKVEIAMAYRKIGDLDRALAHMKEAVDFKPGEGWMRDILGNLYQEKGELLSAITQYEEAVRLEPNEPEFRTDLANAYAKKGENYKALQQYKALYRIVEGLTGEGVGRDYAKEARFASDMIGILEAQKE